MNLDSMTCFVLLLSLAWVGGAAAEGKGETAKEGAGEGEETVEEEPAEPVTFEEATVNSGQALSALGAAYYVLEQETSSGEGGAPQDSAELPGKARGGKANWPKIYKKLAPAVVFLVGGENSGTGFLIDRDGWMITNEHVAAGCDLDPARRCVMRAYLGRQDARGRMVPEEEPLIAVRYKWDKLRDLALMKIEGLETWDGDLVTIPISSSKKTQPVPGMEVAAIGNGAVRLLWSMKPGHVNAVGPRAETSPDLLMCLDVLKREGDWGWSEEELAQFKIVVDRKIDEMYEWSGDVWLLETTAESIPGDSGSPLLDAKGRLLGVNRFSSSLRDGSTDAYYAVHRDEVVEFLEDWPKGPELALQTDIWRSGAFMYKLAELSIKGANEGEWDVLFGNTYGQELMVAFDLDGDIGHEGQPTPDTVVEDEHFDAEFVMMRDYRAGYSTAMYDLDDAAGFELVLVDDLRDGTVDAVYRLVDGALVLDADFEVDSFYLGVGEMPKGWRTKYEGVVDLCRNAIGETY
jgi:S1-C subfamily serine protease